jgi:cytochrome c
MRIPITLAAAGVAFLVTTATQAQKASLERGRVFAETNCARCHAIGPTGDSPVAKAPPFRTLHNRYPVENLEEALAEGIRTDQERSASGSCRSTSGPGAGRCSL